MKHSALRIFLCLFFATLFTGCLASCGNSQKDFCQAWYEEGFESPSFILYDDNTCEISGEYGIGTWAIVNGDTIKFTNAYDESTTWQIESISKERLVLLYPDGDALVFWNSPEASLAAAEETKQKEEEAARLEAEKQPPKITLMSNYQEGFAWIIYEEKGKTYRGFIDKQGNVVVRFSDSIYMGHSDFVDGYAHVSTRNDSYIVDTKGNVTKEYSTTGSELEQLAGYTVTVEELSNFDSVGYRYLIYSPDGSILDEFEHEDKLDSDQVTYCGKGVFKFSGIGYFCASNNTWTDWEDGIPEFYDDIAVVSSTYYDVDDSLYSDRFAGLVMLSSTGEKSTVYSKYMPDAEGSVIIDDICVLYSGTELSAINLSTGEEFLLSEEYSSKIRDDLEVDEFSPYDGRIVVCMVGADQKGYIGVFDTQMNLLFGPIQGYAKAYSNERLVVSTPDGYCVYNLDGNLVYSLEDKGLISTEQYSSGVLMAWTRNYESTYLDTEGNYLFDSLDSSNATTYE